MPDFAKKILSVIPTETEFWSAVVGAIVGGLIALAVQLVAIRAGRKQRGEDRKEIQKALGNSLLFKLIRIHSNIFGIHQHIESCLQNAELQKLSGELWQFVTPLINPPVHVNFTSDEMALLLSLKSDEIFNSVMSLDVVHNSHIDSLVVLNTERRALTDRIRAQESSGNVLGGNLTREQVMLLKPKMIEVNSLIEQLRQRAKEDSSLANKALIDVNKLLRDKVGLTYKLQFESKISKTS